MTKKTKLQIKNVVKDFLFRQKNIQSAFFYGSFTTETSYNDIDIAIFRTNIDRDLLEMETELESKLSTKLQIKIDLRIVNNAPESFLYEVFKGECLFDKNDKISNLIEKTIISQMDEEYYKKQFLKDLIND